jgi:hypothetical protein
MMSGFNLSDEESLEKARQVFGPGHVDHFIRQAVQFCWIGLPKDKRNVDELERQIRRIVDRALCDIREDLDSIFGKDYREKK